MPFCHKCGAQNEPEAVYCEECGSRLMTAGQPVSPGTPASVEPLAPPGAPPAPMPLADAGIPAPPEPSPPSELPMPQRGPCRRRCALVLVAALVAGIIGVGIFIAVSSRGGGDEGEGTSVRRETPEATAAPSPTVKATPKRSPTTKATASPKSTPTRAPIATPTEEVEPPTASQGAQVKTIAAWVEGYGEQYAGDCATTNVETDAGKYCTSLQEDRGDSAIYLIGLSFSEFDTWLLLERVGSDWVVSDWAGVVDGEMVPPW